MTTTKRDGSEPARRTSIWSVSEGWLTAYFALFTIQFIVGVSLVVWYETVVVTHDSPIETLMNIFERAGVIPILSASTSYIFAEGGRLTMVISNWVERKLEERERKRDEAFIAKVRAEVEEEVRTEAFEQGRAYERKLIDAETNGKDSDEQALTDSKRLEAR